MKQFAKSFLCLSLLLALSVVNVRAASCDDCSEYSLESCNVSCNNSCDVSVTGTCHACSSVYIPRPTYNNTAYFWFPWRKDIDCEFNGIMELGFEYQRSFSGKHIAESLFGSERLHFQGSSITGVSRDPRALIADNFGLSNLCDATVIFKPRIENYNLNFHGRLGFDNWVEGLYGEVYFAFTHQNRHLGLHTVATNNASGCSFNNVSNNSCNISDVTGCNVSDNGCSNSCDYSNNCSVSDISACGITTSTACTTPFPQGYMAPTATATVPSLLAALDGQSSFGDMKTKWAFGRFPRCSQTKNAVSGVALVAGWNFWQNDCGHFGAFFQYVAPTGNKPKPEFLFSPVVGNGKHHEVGGGISAHYELWNNDCDQSLNVYLDGYVMTALSNCQLRSFDFCGKGCLSRYMLLEKLTPTTNVYAEGLIDGINFTTRHARVKVNVKGDASLRFVYSNGGFNFGLGYNAYGQARERVHLAGGVVKNCEGAPAFDTTVNYGFKGCAQLYNTNGLPFTTALTQSNATIRSCGTNDATTQVIQDPVGTAVTNCGASSCDQSVATTCAPTNCNVSNVSGNCSNVSNNCSGASNTLCNGVLDIRSGEAPKQFTNKGFATMDYTWAECNYAPYLGIGGEAEAGSHRSLNQWGVWIKGGIQF